MTASDAAPAGEGLAAAAERAAHLIANYLWNEDGESEGWLHEAHDALRAALQAAERSEPLDVERLARAMATADFGERAVFSGGWVEHAEKVLREYARLADSTGEGERG